MYVTSGGGWLPLFTRFDDHAAIGNAWALRAATERGEMHRIALGIYLPATTWDALDVDARYRASVHAAVLRYPDEIMSHHSAAALWRLPIIDRWPVDVESVIDRASGGRSRVGLRRHAVGSPAESQSIDGARVTPLARTVVDLAATTAFSQGVVFADRVLAVSDPLEGIRRPALTRGDLEAEAGTGSPKWAARIGRVVSFADGRSGSPGESLSRVAIHMLGFPEPKLQTAFWDSEGLIGYSDFWWPEHGVLGEFDGAGKYLRDDLRAGKTVAEVVIAEKRREDRLRAHPDVRTVSRWDWRVARNLRSLEAQLRRAGLPQARRC